MASLPTTQEDANDSSSLQSSLCNQTSDMNPDYNYPTQDACTVDYAVKESLSETTDLTVENTRADTNALHSLQANHKEDQLEVVSQQEVISKEENQEVKQCQCIAEKVFDKEPKLVEFADASIRTIDRTEYLPEVYTEQGDIDSVSRHVLTRGESTACSSTNRDMRIEKDVTTCVDQQEKEYNVDLNEQSAHGPGLMEGCLSQEHSQVHPSVTFATPLEEYFEYAVSLNPAAQTPEPTLEFSVPDCETSMYDADENKFPGWKIPSSFDVALCKRNHIDESIETGHNHAITEGCLTENNEENKLKEESESEKSLKEDAFPIVYRAPSELLEANLDDDIAGIAIKRCIDNSEGWTYGGSQEEHISSNMNCNGVSSSPTESTKLPGNDNDLLHPEVEQVITSVIQQVMAAMSPEADVNMHQRYQRITNKDSKEKRLNSLCIESCDTEGVSEKIKDVSANATTAVTTDTVTEHSASPIPHDDQVSQCPKQESGQTTVGEAMISSSQEQGYSHCSQARNASTPQHQLHIINVIEMEEIECRYEPLRRDSGKPAVEELQRHGTQENQEQLSPNATTPGTSVKVENNNKVIPTLGQAGTYFSQEDDTVETNEGDPARVISPVKKRELGGTCVPDADIDSSQALFNSFTSQTVAKSPEESSQLLVTDGNVNGGKTKESQYKSELGLDKQTEHTENQVSGLPKQESGQTEREAIVCEREPGVLDGVLHTDHEEMSPGWTRREANTNKDNDEVVIPKTGILDLLLSQEDMFENDPDDCSRAAAMEEDVLQYSMKDMVETHHRDIGGVASPVKYGDLEGICDSDGSIDSPETVFHSFTSQKNTHKGSQSPGTDRNGDIRKPDTQSGHELDSKKETQCGRVSSHIVNGLGNIGDTDHDSIDQRSDTLPNNLQDDIQTGAYRHSKNTCVEEITPLDEAYGQNMHRKNGSHNDSASDTSERHGPRDQSQSHKSGDDMTGMDNVPCRMDPLKGSGNPGPFDHIEVLDRVVRRENHEEISADSTTAQTAGKNNDRMAPNTDKADHLLSQDDMFENEPNDGDVALCMKDDAKKYSPESKAETYDEKTLAGVDCSVKIMESEGEHAVWRDSSQTLFHSFPSPNSSPPPSITPRKSSDEGSQLPVSDFKVAIDKTEAQCDGESHLKTETQPCQETPYSVTDSPYARTSGGDGTDQDKDIVKQYPQDLIQGNAFGKSVTSSEDPAYMENIHSNNGGQDDCENSGILSEVSKDGNVLCSHISGHSAVLSQTHVSVLEGIPALEEAFEYSTSITSGRHDVIKAQQEIPLLTPTRGKEFEQNETDIESCKSINVEPTDVELLVEEISQKLDLTLEHLSPTSRQKYSLDDYKPSPFDPLQSEFVKVRVVRSQSQSSIICLQSLHDNMPDSETDETDSRSKPSSQRHSLKRRSATQDMYIPTKTQRSDGIYPISQPPDDVSDPEDSTDGEGKAGGKGEAALVGLTHIQPPTGKFTNANGADRISCQSPASEDCTVPDSNLIGTEQQLRGSPQGREDQAVPGNMEELGATTLQCHLVEQDTLSLYDDRTSDSKRGVTLEFRNRHDEKTQRLEKFQQFPPASATDTSPPSSTPEDTGRSCSPTHHDHHTVPGSPRSSFRWRYAPSVDFDSVSVVHENMADEDASFVTCRPLPLVTCRRPLRVGLSRRHRAPSLHPNFRAPRRLHDV